MIFTTTAVYPLGEKLWGCRRSTALYLLWGHCPLKHKNLGSLKSLPELNCTHKLTMAVQGLNNCLTLSNLELTKDHVLQARMLWFFIRRHKCRKCVLSQKQGVLCHLFDVLHLFHVLHVIHALQTYSMFNWPCALKIRIVTDLLPAASDLLEYRIVDRCVQEWHGLVFCMLLDYF